MHPSYTDKIMERSAFCSTRARLRESGTTLAHCHGCFDIVHPGHIRHLRFAAEQCDRLIVSITPDRFIDKGPDRPMFTEDLRAENLAALSFVDWVVINDQPTACQLLSDIAPDVYVKGAEYALNQDPRFIAERDAVESLGGRVVFSSDDVVYSSSAIIDSIRSIRDSIGPDALTVALARDHDLTTRAVARVFENARGKHVFVLGESIIDIYEHCRWPETAQEHPMLSLCPEHEDRYDGGAAVIALHLAAMGLEVTLCTPIGSDETSASFVERMQHAGVRIEGIACVQSLPKKIRYLVGRDKVMKIDSPTRYAFDSACADRIVNHLHEETPYNAMVIADFGFGLFANQLASKVIGGARNRVGMILGDVSGRRAQLREMRGADVLCPCEVELRQMLDADEEPIGELIQRATEITGVQTLCVTRADEGLVIADKSLGVFTLPAFCNDPIDVLGCGDALLTAMTASLLGGADRVQSGFIGSLSAAIQGETRGNLPISASQIIERAQQLGARLMLDQGVTPTPDIGIIEAQGYPALASALDEPID